MQATGHLSFTCMLSAGCLHGHFHVLSFLLVHQVREPWESQFWKSHTALAIDQASD